MPTLAEHCKRSLKAINNLSEVPLQGTIYQLNAFLDKQEGNSRVPEHDAIRFYMLNHAFACLQDKFEADEPLGKYNAIAESYFEESCEATARAFYYLLLICTRESRHVKNASSIRDSMDGKHGPQAMQFNDLIRGKDSVKAAEILRKHPPEMPLGRFTASLVDIFNTGVYHGGYGGTKWGLIAKCLHEFVGGKTSAEMMMDTVWTLSHNNGPIFNKGMLYATHSHELVTILDIQRSGQIPQMVYDCELGANWVSRIMPHHMKLRKNISELLGGDFTAHLNWDTVEKLGSVHLYSEQKQKAKTLFPDYIVEDTKVAHVDIAKPEEDHGTYFFITQKQKLLVIQREK